MFAGSFTEISIYVMAHADDCQLFMQPQMFRNLVDEKHKNVFIITTAGDAGFEEKFWKAREEGFKSSVRFCLAPLGEITESTAVTTINEHRLFFCRINNSIIYFLRLPDGNLDSAGFAANHFESLEKLRSGKISEISAVDKSTAYVDWKDLQQTLKALILAESARISKRSLYYLNPNPDKSSYDHPDHLNTGRTLDLIENGDNFQKVLFAGYGVANEGNNLTAKELFWKIGMFAVYEKTVFDATGYSTLREGEEQYLKWCLSCGNCVHE